MFVERLFSRYVHNKMTKEESKSIILGTFAILTQDFRSDDQKLRMIEDVYKTVFMNRDQKKMPYKNR